MSRYDSGGKLEKFFAGKGFYIVLFLCASVIGVSAWMLMAGNETMIKETENEEASFGYREADKVFLPPEPQEMQPVIKEEIIVEEPPEINSEGLAEPEKPSELPQEETAETFEEAAASAPEYIWPLSGQIERYHDGDKLKFDETMQDWRSHEGVDILSTLGCPVAAVRAGTVAEVKKDSLYGVTVRIDHGDGIVSVYSNLEEPAAVSVGQSLNAGDTVGAVGSSAICESSQASHLHFAIEANGRTVNPLDYLPA